jgi:uncharacterized membrane protein
MRARLRSAAVDHRVILAAVVVLAIVLRFVGIGARLAIDDAYSYLVAAAGPHHFLAQLAATENTPPLFYMLLGPLPLEHEAWLKLPSAVAGTLMCVVLYCSLRNPFGERVALLAALATAVSPFLVTYSNLARGFMVEDLALLVGLWAMLKLSERDSRRWWLIYGLATILALYTEYDAAIFVMALTATAAWLAAPDRRRRLALLGLAPLISLAAWIPELVRAQDQVGVTKLAPHFPAPSLTALRDATVTLAFGEYGGTTRAVGRWLEFVALALLTLATAILLRRTAAARDRPARRALALVAGTAALTLVGHVIAGLVGFNLFNQRYMTIMVPLAATLAAAAVVSIRGRAATALAAVVLSALGVVGIVRRYDHEYQPDLAPVRAAAIALHPRTILTDTPVVLYYLRSLHPTLDRPFDLGPGRAATCGRPCLIIDDLLTNTGTPRQLTGRPAVIEGRFGLTLLR